MSVRVGVNGFGRIGRNFYRAADRQGCEVEVVAVNDLGDTATMAHLLKYDSVLGNLPHDIATVEGGIEIDGTVLPVLSERNPADVRWPTSAWTSWWSPPADSPRVQPQQRTSMRARRSSSCRHGIRRRRHHRGGRERCRLRPRSAHGDLECKLHHELLRADGAGARPGIRRPAGPDDHHSRLHRRPVAGGRAARRSAQGACCGSEHHSDFDRRRPRHRPGAGLDGRQLDGTSLRVPIPDGSITDFTATLDAAPSVEEVNEAFAAAAAGGPLAGVLEYSEDPLVSSDIVGNPASCVFDAGLTMAMGTMVKVLGWYDNEWGYSNRLVDLVEIACNR